VVPLWDLKRMKVSRVDSPSVQDENMILGLMLNMVPGSFCPFEFAGSSSLLYIKH